MLVVLALSLMAVSVARALTHPSSSFVAFALFVYAFNSYHLYGLFVRMAELLRDRDLTWFSIYCGMSLALVLSTWYSVQLCARRWPK
jgi:predicted permease